MFLCYNRVHLQVSCWYKALPIDTYITKDLFYLSKSRQTYNKPLVDFSSFFSII